MNSVENPFSTSSLSTSEKPEGLDKKETDSSKKKSRQVGFRLIDNEVKSKEKPEVPNFSLLESDKDKQTPPLESAKDNVDMAIEDNEHEEDELYEAPLESLSNAEELEIAQIIRSEARQTRAEVNEVDEAEQVVNEALEDYDSKIVDEGMAPETAMTEVLENYGIDPNTVNIEQVNDESETESLNSNEQEIDLLAEGGEGEVSLETGRPEAVTETVDNEEDQPAAGGSGGNGGKRPPTTFSGSGPDFTPPPPNPWRSTRFRPNIMPVPTSLSNGSYNQIRRDHRDYWSGFMTGGIVGYYVGHRRGRIKTEKKLQSVKKNLEKQVNKIDKKLQTQEFTIRKLVKERALNSTERLRPVKTERIRNPKQPEILKAIKKETLAPIAAAEIHIGKLVMSERPKEVLRRETVETAKNNSVERNIPELHILEVPVDSMNHAQLLKASESVIIDGSSLRQIYETQLVGEKGLRRLLNEYVRGGDLQKALNKEILERQIDFERDPAMRDTAAPSSSSAAVTDHQSLESMIKRAEAALTNSQEEVAFLKAKAAHEDKQQYQHSRAINAVFLSIITFLVAVIILISLLKQI